GEHERWAWLGQMHGHLRGWVGRCQRHRRLAVSACQRALWRHRLRRVDLFLFAGHCQVSTGTHLATRYAVSPSHISADLTADWSNHRSTVSMTPMTVGPVPRSSRTSTSGRPPSNETRSAPKAKLSRLASAFALPTSPTTKRISIADLLDRKLA